MNTGVGEGRTPLGGHAAGIMAAVRLAMAIGLN